MVKRMVMVLAMIFLAAAVAQGAGYVGMVLDNTADGVKINRGVKDTINEGLILYVVRYGEVIGKVQVVKVDQYSSMAKILESKTPISKGDTLYDTIPEGAASSSSPQVMESKGASSPKESSRPAATTGASRKASAEGAAPSSSASSSKKSVKAVQTNTYTKDFEKSFKTRTKVVQFKAGSGGKLNISIVDLFQFYNAIQVSGSTATQYDNYIGSGVTYPSWWPIASEVGDMYGRYHYSNVQNRRTQTSIQITYWDEDLLNKFAAYFAYKETMSDDQAKRDAIQQSIYRDKGLEKYYVFEVVIMNGGPGVMQLAPLNWHLYLLDGSNTRYKAEKYDQVLDKALNPKQSVRGLIYFPRKDASGRTLGSPTAMRLKVEDVLGESAVVSW
jgi:hypothetical protein